MKSKHIIYSFLLAFGLGSCDYLDLVPDERPILENTYQNPAAAKKFLYSCYSKIPVARASEALDKFSAAEIVNGVEKDGWSTFPRGYYSPSSLGLTDAYYKNIWNGVRRCHDFLEVVELTPDLLEIDLQYYKAEANFLIAYYHFLSLVAYGPSVIMDKKHDPSTSVTLLPERSSYEDVVDFIDKKLEEVIPNLAQKQEGDDYGRITKYAALALRSRLHLYAASPLANGNSEFYANFKSPTTGEPLMSLEYKKEKWEKAAAVTKAAIDTLEAAGYRLYTKEDAGAPSAQNPGPVNNFQRAVRYTFMDNVGGMNPEVIMVDTRKETTYMIQNQSTPIQNASNGYKNSWTTIAPTLDFVELFHTKNGLPIDEDPTFDYEGRFDIVKMPANYDGNNYSTISNGTTIKLHLNRESRFFSWIGFHNGNFEIAKYDGKPTSNVAAKKRIKLEFRKMDKHGKKDRTGNFSGSGYLNKKFVHPAFQNGPIHYSYPLIRMAELYLNYAEILVELEDLPTAKFYADKIRTRAGVPTIDVAWQKAINPNKANTKEGLREIVRTERQIELYLENHRFWDLRRWKIADILGKPVRGLNIDGTTDEEFFKDTEHKYIRNFKTPAQYLMPIPQREVNKCPQIIQNPHY